MTMSLPEHLFAADDGALYDTRELGWPANPLRREFRRHFLEINSTAQLKATLRAGQTSDLGGYPLFFMAADSSVYSFEGVRANLSAHIAAANSPYRTNYSFHDAAMLIVACCINYEDELWCDWTGNRIPSAYAPEGELDEARVYDAEGWEEF